MFTGIIEAIGEVTQVQPEGTNIHFTIASNISNQLKIDQSVAHNGVCLTITAYNNGSHTVTAIQESLDKSNLGEWKTGSKINLERCLKIGDRLDGHMVQGHVDTTATCVSRSDQNGSSVFTFEYKLHPGFITVEKGSITLNGISLTVFNSQPNSFSVAIIPYTLEHTNFKDVSVGTSVNIEFDILGKYVTQFMNSRNPG
jgi:riboflavin synthase